jgi:hypothetical protein
MVRALSSTFVEVAVNPPAIVPSIFLIKLLVIPKLELNELGILVKVQLVKLVAPPILSEPAVKLDPVAVKELRKDRDAHLLKSTEVAVNPPVTDSGQFSITEPEMFPVLARVIDKSLNLNAEAVQVLANVTAEPAP